MSETITLTVGGAEAKMARLAARTLRSAPSRQTDLEDPDQLGTVPANDARVAGIAANRLRSIIERWERLDEEVKALRADQKDIMTEAQSAGFVPAVVKQLIAIRRKDAAEVEEQATLLALYQRALEA